MKEYIKEYDTYEDTQYSSYEDSSYEEASEDSTEDAQEKSFVGECLSAIGDGFKTALGVDDKFFIVRVVASCFLTLALFFGVVYYVWGSSVKQTITETEHGEGIVTEKTPNVLTIKVGEEYFLFSVDEQTYCKYHEGDTATVAYTKVTQEHNKFKPKTDVSWTVDGVPAKNDRSGDIYLQAINQKAEEERRKKQEEYSLLIDTLLVPNNS